MAKKKSNSRLKETAFSQYNLRDAYITDMAEYAAVQRDESLFSNYGLTVLIRIPALDGELQSNYVDEYSNFVNNEWIETTESVIPLFNEYRQVLDENGLTADGEDGLYPLSVILPSKLYLPRNSRIIFNEYDCQENKVAREWMVLGTVRKQLSNGKTYSNIANCVPARQGTVDTSSQVGSHTIWFDWEVDQYGFTKLKDIRAQGTLWFVNKLVEREHSIRAIENAIWEQVPENPNIIEEIRPLIYYDARPKHIIDSGVGFVVGDEFDVYDNEGNQIYIDTSEDGKEKLPLIFTVTDVDSRGGITNYKLNVETGYTSLSITGDLVIELEKTKDFPAIINLVSIIANSASYEETIMADIIEKPKYFTPYTCNCALVGKKVALSVVS